LKKEQSLFHRKSGIMGKVWKDRRLVRIISAIHDSAIVNTRRKDRKTNKEIINLMLLSSAVYS